MLPSGVTWEAECRTLKLHTIQLCTSMYMAVSINLGSISGVYIRPLDFCKLPHKKGKIFSFDYDSSFCTLLFGDPAYL